LNQVSAQFTFDVSNHDIPESETFSYFKRNDSLPKLQRRVLFALNSRHINHHKDNLQSSRTLADVSGSIVLIQVKGESGGKKLGLGGKLNALLRSKAVSRTRTGWLLLILGLFHSLYLAVHDFRSMDAAACLDILSESSLIKKRPNDANKVFLTAMANRLQGVCLIMIEKGFPVNVNAPIFGGTNQSLLIFPSYFQLAVVFDLIEVCKAMIKVLCIII
jgi:hypothetical protein